MPLRSPARRARTALLLALAFAAALPATSALAAPEARTPTPEVEAFAPYQGQTACEQLLRAGVVQFRDLVLAAYPETGDSGMLRSCGVGGVSEHKEGRAWDWRVSADDPEDVLLVDDLMTWLLAPDELGNPAAMARRLGLMYVIWDSQVWKSYQAAKGWQPYSGASPHTDHVHFSFGWNGAKKVTSWWDKTVAPIDFGPRTSPRITPVRALSNLPVLRTYGSTSLHYGSGGSTVTYLQKRLQVPADGDYGSVTATAVAHFQVDQRLEPTQRWGPLEWKTLLPLPQAPIGKVDTSSFALGNLLVTGWSLDLDTTDPIRVTASVDGVAVQTVTADLPRADVQKAYPEWGGGHGYTFVLPVVDGTHTVCLTARNATGTPGVHTSLGCRDASAQHSPVGALDSATPGLGSVTVRGWALDPDTADAVTTSLTVDGVASAVSPTATSRPDIGLRYPGVGDLHGVEAELSLQEGTHQVCLSVTNALGTDGQDAVVGCRSVTVTHSPVAAVEVTRRAPGGVVVTGWALDPDVADPAAVELLSDGRVVTTVLATASRPSLATSWPQQGTGHGFSAVLDLPVGARSVCVRVPNADGTPGSAVTLPCRSVTVSHDPAGVVTANRTLPGGTVLVAGDAYDPDTLAGSPVTVLVDGVAVRTVPANRTSPTAAARWPGYGVSHAFATSLTLRPGIHSVCVRADNVTGTAGASRALGCRTLVVANGVGAVNGWSLSGRTVTARGWALDPDSTKANRAALAVDGRTVTTVVASRERSALSRLMPGYGTGHGYVLVTTLSRGRHTVCVASRNLTGTAGTFRSVGCKSIYVF